MLFEGTVSDIKIHCSYHVFLPPVPRGIIKRTQNKLLFTNISRVNLECSNDDIPSSQTLIPTQLQFAHEVPCSCLITADEFFLPHSYLDCEILNLNVTASPLYLANLPYLTEYFSHDVLEHILEDMYLNDSVQAILPPLAVASKQYQAKLAVEQKAQFEMTQILNQTKNDGEVFDNLAHYLYNVLLDSHLKNQNFDVLNPWDWLLVISMVCSVIAIALAVLLKLKLRTVMIMLAGVKPARAADTVLKFTQPTP